MLAEGNLGAFFSFTAADITTQAHRAQINTRLDKSGEQGKPSQSLWRLWIEPHIN